MALQCNRQLVEGLNKGGGQAKERPPPTALSDVHRIVRIAERLWNLGLSPNVAPRVARGVPA